jgi:hypothetical protein
MAGQTDQQPPQTGTPVPDLIERYRSRRDAWIAQADELARLRDEVRGSAEREAMEIVTAARRDVRKVIMEARRELLVLSAQVQAALGEAAPKTDPAALLNKAGITPESSARALSGPIGAFAPEGAVNEILNEVHDDMTSLAEDARALPLQAVPPARQIPSPAPLPPPPPPAPAATARPTPHVVSPPKAPAPTHELFTPLSSLPEPLEIPEFNEAASKLLLSSPFPSDAVPVPNGKRLRTILALFAGVGLAVVGMTIWWTSDGSSGGEPSAASTPATTPSGTSTAPGAPESSRAASTEKPSPLTPQRPANLSLVAEAVRDVWVRTTVDGRTDDGRTLAAGQAMDVSAEQSITLRAGDAGAIVVSVNRGEKRPLGRDGQVVTRQFVVEDAQRPRRAPAPAPSATPAPQPSGNTRATPPIAQATPVAPSNPAPNVNPSSAGSASTSPSSAAAPRPTFNQLTANPPQPTVPSGVVNQLSAPAPPPPSPAPVAAVPPTTVAPQAASPATTVVAIARQWLDAYHRQDRATMAALSTDNVLLADERRADERFPANLTDVTRTLDRVNVQIAADTAVLTAVMMEQSSSSSSPHVSPISQVWVLGGGQWKVRQARFVSQARLNQVFK